MAKGEANALIGDTSFDVQSMIFTCMTTAAAPASGVEAVVRSPTNMAAAKIEAVDFNKITPK